MPQWYAQVLSHIYTRSSDFRIHGTGELIIVRAITPDLNFDERFLRYFFLNLFDNYFIKKSHNEE